MKGVVLIASVLLGLTGFSQGTINWEPEITVSDGVVYGNFRPRATVVGNTPLVVYGRTGTDNLFVSRWNGTGFDTQGILPSGSSTYIAGWTGPDIASTNDTVIAVFKLNPAESGKVYIVRSIDGGQSFSDTIRVSNYSGGNVWMPSMDMRADGNPVVAMMVHDGAWGNPRYVLAHSNDGGLTYGPVEEVVTSIPGEACDCCPAEVVIDGDKEMMLFRNNDANIRDVFGVFSNDAGQTFPYAENLDQLSWNIASCPSTGMDGVFMNDDFYMVYASAAEGMYRVYLSKSTTANGLVFDTVQQVIEPTPSNGTQNYPTISGANDTLVMVWEERISFNKEIYYSVAVPGVDPMHALTTYKFQANATSTGNQTNPEVIYKNGFVHLFYQDDGTGDLIYRRGQIDVNLGLEEQLATSISVYPNPVKSTCTVTSEQQITDIKVMDVLGRDIQGTYEIKGKSALLNFDPSASGLHYIHLQFEDGTTGVSSIMIK